jgi:hypothetical protein
MSNEKILSEKIINLVEKITSGEMAETVKRLQCYIDVKKALESRNFLMDGIIAGYLLKDANLPILLKNSAFVDAIFYEVDKNIKFLEDKLVDLFNLQSSTDNNNINN